MKRPGLENVSVNACGKSSIPPATRNAGRETSSRDSTKLPPTAKSSSIMPAIATERRARLRRLVGAGREAGYDGGLDRPDCDKQRSTGGLKGRASKTFRWI